MKTQRFQNHPRVTLNLTWYGSYLDEVSELEKMLATKPKWMSIDLMGAGRVPADTALLIRSIILKRSPRTRVITHARSSLRDGAVLVWLLGDQRLMRDDATLYFRAAGPYAAQESVWRDRDVFDDDDVLDQAANIRVLHAINEFLPVKELAGQLIELPILKQFGLVNSASVDDFLLAAFRKEEPHAKSRPPARRRAPVRREKL